MKEKKEKTTGFAYDKETGKLINAGAKLHLNGKGKPSKSNFLRAAIHQYFEK
jgi:hypothetical protein